MSFYSLFAPYYEQVFPFRNQVYSFLRTYSGRPGDAMLDAGCGTGHYCGMFLRDGFRVTGIDLDPMMIDAASATYPQGSFHCMDMAGIGSLQSLFRLIYSIGNVLAYLPHEEVEQFLRAVHAALETGGYWVFQVVNWDYLLTLKEYSFPVKSIAGGSLTFHRRYSLISPEQVIFDVKLISSQGITVFNEHSKIYPYSTEIYLRLHEAAGFTLEGIYSGFDKSLFVKESDSALVLVFTKR